MVGYTCDYDRMWKNIVKRNDLNSHIIPGAVTDWDNSPRKQYNAQILKHVSPEKFARYFSELYYKASNAGCPYIIVNAWNEWFLENGYDLELLNLGGGLGVNYSDPDKEITPDFKRFFDTFATHLTPRSHQKIHFELGRSLVANCGSLIAKVLYVKEGETKRFAVLDAGMTELLRPALYQAEHKIQKLGATNNCSVTTCDYDIVGPICESSDYFGRDVCLPALTRGDVIAIRSTGAYGEVMSLKYNMRKTHKFYYQE